MTFFQGKSLHSPFLLRAALFGAVCSAGVPRAAADGGLAPDVLAKLTAWTGFYETATPDEVRALIRGAETDFTDDRGRSFRAFVESRPPDTAALLPSAKSDYDELVALLNAD